MLVLTRKVGEFLLLGEEIEVRIVRVDGDQVRLGIVAPRSVSIVRGELLEDIRKETQDAAAPAKADVAKLALKMQHLGKRRSYVAPNAPEAPDKNKPPAEPPPEKPAT